MEGDPVLLLHQSPRSSRIYVKLIPLIANRYRAIAIDMLGFGNSDPPPQEVRIPDMALNVIHVLDALEIEKCHLFGTAKPPSHAFHPSPTLTAH